MAEYLPKHEEEPGFDDQHRRKGQKDYIVGMWPSQKYFNKQEYAVCPRGPDSLVGRQTVNKNHVVVADGLNSNKAKLCVWGCCLFWFCFLFVF